MKKRLPIFSAGLMAAVAGLFLNSAIAQQAPAPGARTQTALEKKGIDYLLSQQDKDGAWLPQVGPGVTAMVVRGLVQSQRTAEDPAVKKALVFIESCKQKDGGYYKDSLPNYNSSIVLSMYAALSDAEMAGKVWRGPRPYDQQITGLQNFLKSLQQDESKDVSGKPLAQVPNGTPITRNNSWYGGSGYSEDRPDMSNTSFFMEALHDSGVPGSDPAMQKALVFVSRSQMLGETNDQAFAKGATDGGFIYTPVGGGDSKFGDIDSLDGSSMLRSYGSMTYSGFKSLLYAGLTEDDPRVKAAIKWISNNWTLEYNPGSGGSADGQYYYLHAFSRAMHAYNHDQIPDAKGVRHDWRKELNDFLAKAQKPDGSWVNEKSPRWLEGNPVLPTAYAVLALQEGRK
jgi:squalene-hopene/tetraprenyl-beta-curcumene cyclase